MFLTVFEYSASHANADENKIEDVKKFINL